MTGTFAELIRDTVLRETYGRVPPDLTQAKREVPSEYEHLCSWRRPYPINNWRHGVPW